jgi:hypothetical protein
MRMLVLRALYSTKVIEATTTGFVNTAYKRDLFRA